MYFVGSRNVVRAVSATSGELIWQYDPKVTEHAGNRLRVSFLHGSRGVALWQDKVFVGTADGRLIAVGARTGKEVWSVMTVDPEKALYITGAPKVLQGQVNAPTAMAHSRSRAALRPICAPRRSCCRRKPSATSCAVARGVPAACRRMSS